MDDPTYLATFERQCVELNANPAPGIDVAELCACAVKKAFSGRSGLYAFASSPAGEQVISQAGAQCKAEQATGGGAAQPGTEAEEEDAAEGEQ
jgi:hypothetical protein